MALVVLGKVAVTTAGTPERITKNLGTPSARVGCQRVQIQALAGNTNLLYVGSSALVKATGVGVMAALSPGGSITLDIPMAPAGLNAADIWLDGDTNGNSAYVTLSEQ